MNLYQLIEDQNPWWQEPGARRANRFPVRRDLQKEVLERVCKLDDRRAVVILGPRQVGKTTLLLQTADDLLSQGWPGRNLTYFDFSDDRLTGNITAREIVEASPTGSLRSYPRVFLFDEIRLSPKWGPWLKQMVDADLHRIVVTDSASSILRDEGRESGQGRWDEYLLEGLTFREFARLHSSQSETEEETIRRIPNLLERYLAAGGFPEHAYNEDYFEVRRRLRTDIVDKAIHRDLAGMGVNDLRVKELFIYLMQDSGSIFDAVKRAEDLRPKADPRSVREWVHKLESTLLVVPLPRNTRYAAARLRSRPKMYASDHGLVVSFSSSPLREEIVRSRVFEAVIFRHLRDAAKKMGGELSYFRRNDRLEIDFVFEGKAGNAAIEVTCSPNPAKEKKKSLQLGGRAVKAARLLTIHGGMLDRSEDGIQFIPLQRFLLDPISILESRTP